MNLISAASNVRSSDDVGCVAVSAGHRHSAAITADGDSSGSNRIIENVAVKCFMLDKICSGKRQVLQFAREKNFCEAQKVL